MKRQTRLIARKWLSEPHCILDTETTGLDELAEIVEISILDEQGQPLLDTFCQPTRAAIDPKAQAVHGIDAGMLADAPNFTQIAPQILAAIQGRRIIIYNAEFDLRLLFQSLYFSDKAICAEFPFARLEDNTVCAMTLYAQFYGDWNNYYQSYRWQSLKNAALQCGFPLPSNLHRAAGDAELCRQVVHYMANYQFKGEKDG